MELLKHRPWGLLLIGLLLGSCEQEPEAQRRSLAQFEDADGQTSRVDATGSAGPTPDEAGYGSLDTDFRPDDPNTFSRKAGVAFPSVNFAIEGVPSGSSDIYNLTLPVKADPSISHYAYKIDSDPSCSETGGYTVGEAKKPIILSLDKLPMGPLYLCAIAFHFPTRQWQDLSKAVSHSWQKIAFKRTIDSYFEFLDTTCKITGRFTAKLMLDGDGGSYLWQRVPAPKCGTDPKSYTDLISMLKVTETTMEGAWHEGATVAGWFRFTWSNPERTSFKGTWGYGAPGVKTEGVWNSVDN